MNDYQRQRILIEQAKRGLMILLLFLFVVFVIVQLLLAFGAL